MFAKLPLQFVFTLLIWASVLYTLTSCVQIIFLDRIIKKEFRGQPTDEHKKSIKRIYIRMFIGLGTLILLAVLNTRMKL